MLFSLPGYLSLLVKILLTLQGQVSPPLDTFRNPQSQVMSPSLDAQPLVGASTQVNELCCYLFQICPCHYPGPTASTVPGAVMLREHPLKWVK